MSETEPTTPAQDPGTPDFYEARAQAALERHEYHLAMAYLYLADTIEQTIAQRARNYRVSRGLPPVLSPAEAHQLWRFITSPDTDGTERINPMPAPLPDLAREPGAQPDGWDWRGRPIRWRIAHYTGCKRCGTATVTVQRGGDDAPMTLHLGSDGKPCDMPDGHPVEL